MSNAEHSEQLRLQAFPGRRRRAWSSSARLIRRWRLGLRVVACCSLLCFCWLIRNPLQFLCRESAASCFRLRPLPGESRFQLVGGATGIPIRLAIRFISSLLNIVGFRLPCHSRASTRPLSAASSPATPLPPRRTTSQDWSRTPRLSIRTVDDDFVEHEAIATVLARIDELVPVASEPGA